MFKSENRLNLILFIATIFTTVMCGTQLFGGVLLAGVLFSVCIMTIIGIHESGHYLNAQKHGINTTLPYFIPIPFGIGTMGAIIQFKSGIPNRNSLMDTGAAGPLWGLIAAILVVGLGMYLAPSSEEQVSVFFGNSLLFIGLAYLIKGVHPSYIAMTPILFAGWLGLFITSINLLPIGQLDGGHVFYAMFGKNKKTYQLCTKGFFGGLAIWGVIAFILFSNMTWLIFAFIIFFLSGRTVMHPPLTNEFIDLTPANRIKGWACLIVFILTFMPVLFRG